ncbi:MAG: hypothetical protein IAA73_00475 [Bacteroidetes bacterium]|uniref:Uncharacterized protein n=1 Tax=Candidatus Gallipaludibacter merdavium TaxID=2840839 RepID=A0A9D9HS70_9BACT|nr:hypothetical protein [Candidatus Gallipaludibacter merdavium]
MMHYFKHYLLLIAMAICGIPLSAQTPYDSFAPQAYSPILDWDSIQALQKQEVAEEFTLQADTIVLTPCLAAIDTAEQLVLLVDTLQNMLVCTPLTDKLVRWLSVDPMADDYLHISPYAYCVWNPVGHIDPDGEVALPIAGAILGGVTEIAYQIGKSMFLNGESFSNAVKNINVKNVLVATAAGAISGGIASGITKAAKLYHLGKAGTAVVQGVGTPLADGIGSATAQKVITGEIDANKVKEDVILGALGEMAGAGAKSAMKMNKPSAYKQLQSQLDRAERMAEGSSRTSRINALEKAQQDLENFGAPYTQGTSVVVESEVSIMLEGIKAITNPNNE